MTTAGAGQVPDTDDAGATDTTLPEPEGGAPIWVDPLPETDD